MLLQQRAGAFGIACDAKIQNLPVLPLRLIEVMRLLPGETQIALKVQSQVGNHRQRHVSMVAWGWLEVECNRCKARASLPLDAIRRPRDTPL